MSPLKGNGKVLFKITLFKKKNTALPRWPAINQLSVQAPSLHMHLKAKPVELSSLLTCQPPPGISGVPCQDLMEPR